MINFKETWLLFGDIIHKGDREYLYIWSSSFVTKIQFGSSRTKKKEMSFHTPNNCLKRLESINRRRLSIMHQEGVKQPQAAKRKFDIKANQIDWCQNQSIQIIWRKTMKKMVARIVIFFKSNWSNRLFRFIYFQFSEKYALVYMCDTYMSCTTTDHCKAHANIGCINMCICIHRNYYFYQITLKIMNAVHSTQPTHTALVQSTLNKMYTTYMKSE
jgi:hypothetical protein